MKRKSWPCLIALVLCSLTTLVGADKKTAPKKPAPRPAAESFIFLPSYARAGDYRSLKQSSHDRSGGNLDRYEIAPGVTQEIFRSSGPGIITHMWFTIAALDHVNEDVLKNFPYSENHLKEIVLRAYWDDEPEPSIEVPIGDFFGLNLGKYFIYQSAFLNSSPERALNSYLVMPFRRSARLTVTNGGKIRVGSFYSNIDYQLVSALPDDALYLHVQYRQAVPNIPAMMPPLSNQEGHPLLNPDGKSNYVFCEARGRGQLLGVTMGVLQNHDEWFGEGDDMTFIDDERVPAIIGTGSEDYFLGAFNFGRKSFANLYFGAPFVENAEKTSGKYCLYRWHADNPITFRRYLRHTMEAGHANHRADSFFSVAYWYQTEPHAAFPKLPEAKDRIPKVINLKTP